MGAVIYNFFDTGRSVVTCFLIGDGFLNGAMDVYSLEIRPNHHLSMGIGLDGTSALLHRIPSQQWGSSNSIIGPETLIMSIILLAIPDVLITTIILHTSVKVVLFVDFDNNGERGEQEILH